MKFSKIKLPDDPREALREIASYLRTVRVGQDRAHRELGEREPAGYWQTTEWIDGLGEIAEEAERIAGPS